MRWLESGRTDAFEYLLVDRKTREVTGSLEGVTGCTITESEGTDLKVSARLDLVGAAEFGDNLVRVVSHSTLGPDTETVVHATLVPDRPAVDEGNGKTVGSVNLYSPLVMAQKKLVKRTFVVEPYNCVAWVLHVLELAGIANPETGGPAGYASIADNGAQVQSERVYEAGTSHLAIANDLLASIGYTSLRVDGMGVVTSSPYVVPSSRPVTRVLNSTSGKGITSPVLGFEGEVLDVPNVVQLKSSLEGDDQSHPIYAEARFDSPSSPLSTANRMEVDHYEEVDPVASQSALDAMASRMLSEKLSMVNRCKVTHPYLPCALGDMWTVYGQDPPSEFTGAVYSREWSMTPGMVGTTTLRRFVDVG